MCSTLLQLLVFEPFRLLLLLLQVAFRLGSAHRQVLLNRRARARLPLLVHVLWGSGRRIGALTGLA